MPPTKASLLNRTNEEIKLTEQQYERGEITAIERFQRVIDTWNNASEELKTEVIKYFRETDPLESNLYNGFLWSQREYISSQTTCRNERING